MNVITYPGPALTLRADEVDPSSDSSLESLAKQMADVMYGASGIGLAATQVGVLKRVIVYDMSDAEPSPVALCNPVLVAFSDETEVAEEGCLSFPGISVPVERHVAVTCEGVTLDGSTVTLQASGLHARLLQHEIDHLDGVVILDRATPEDRKDALRRYREAVEAGAKPGDTGP
jgi:peptide deformylase